MDALRQPPTPGTESEPSEPSRESVRILAKSLYRAMRKRGYSRAHAVALATELLDLISEDYAAERLRRC
jgi:hypothetical protein